MQQTSRNIVAILKTSTKAGTVNNVHPRVDEIIHRVINEERNARRKSGSNAELTDEAAQAEIVSATHQLARAVETLSEM